MNTDPLLDEISKIKDRLAAEAGYEAGRFLENLRRWEAEHPHPGRVVHGPEELRTLVDEEAKRKEAAGSALREEPPRTE